MEKIQNAAESGQKMADGMAGQAVTKEKLWEAITAWQGETIYTAKGLPFTYRVKGGELFADTNIS